MLEQFVPQMQLDVIRNVNSEETKYFDTIVNAIMQYVDKMPKTYDTDCDKTPIAYLHYFTGNCDWYITEKDIEAEQHQAFGYVNLGHGFEAGYISLVELMQYNIELDLHFQPQPIKNLV